MKISSSNMYVKMIIVVIITFLLLIPASMIQNTISERENTQYAAIQEVSSKWADQQTITGPFISIPVTYYVRESLANEQTKVVQMTDYLHIMPKNLTINGKIIPNERKRGIYEVVVYESDLEITGSFSKMDLSGFNLDGKELHVDKAEFVIGLNDLGGIEQSLELKLNDSIFPFNPGITSNQVVESGIRADIYYDPSADLNQSFKVQMKLKGSQLLYFTPVGETTDITMHSNWASPKFNGSFLPDERDSQGDQFTAHWNVLHLNRNFPQSWMGSRFSIQESSFGIDLLVPVDNYQKTYRSVRYAILFIGFTFLVFFFIEVMTKKQIHVIQYILVGFALVIFFTLLLSISEHLNFNLAFLISALATLMLVGGYLKSILKSLQLTSLIVGFLTLLYSFIFVIIQLEDYALLMGSIGIFLILGVLMYISRKIDWYQLNRSKE